MFKSLTLILTLTAGIAQAGDMIEGTFLVIGSTPSTLRVVEMTDVATPEFRDTIQTLSDDWSEQCGVPVDVWHTNLMHSEQTPWTPDYWFAYIAFEETERDVYKNAPATGCISESTAKHGQMVIPTLYQICAQPDAYPDIYETSCN